MHRAFIGEWKVDEKKPMQPLSCRNIGWDLNNNKKHMHPPILHSFRRWAQRNVPSSFIDLCVIPSIYSCRKIGCICIYVEMFLGSCFFRCSSSNEHNNSLFETIWKYYSTWNGSTIRCVFATFTIHSHRHAPWNFQFCVNCLPHGCTFSPASLVYQSMNLRLMSPSSLSSSSSLLS